MGEEKEELAHPFFVVHSPIRMNDAGFSSCAELNGVREGIVTRRFRPEGARSLAKKKGTERLGICI